MNRPELETKCDELHEAIVQLGSDWADAKVAHHNFTKLTNDFESKLMNTIEIEETVRNGKELPSVKLKRYAHATKEWKEHKKGLNAAYEKELRIRLEYRDKKKEYELTYARFLKS